MGIVRKTQSVALLMNEFEKKIKCYFCDTTNQKV